MLGCDLNGSYSVNRLFTSDGLGGYDVTRVVTSATDRAKSVV